MTTLHIISTCSQSVLQRCLRYVQNNDAILLINDGVYLAVNTEFPIEYYLLSNDMYARGLQTLASSLLDHSVNYEQFVQLSLEHDNSISWYD